MAPVEIQCYASWLEDGFIVADDDGVFRVKRNFDGVTDDRSPDQATITQRMTDGQPLFKATYHFKVGAKKGYRLVRAWRTADKVHDDGTPVLDKDGRPVGNGAYAIFVEVG